MTYTVVFDVTQAGFREWGFTGPGLVCIFIGLVGMFVVQKDVPKTGPRGQSRWPYYLILGFLLFWGLGAALHPFLQYREALRAMRDGTAQFVEGRVSHFDPMPASGHGLESFSVEGVEFRYSDYVINAGFNNTQSQGGPIREGLPVKIWYFKDQILRLEVAKQ